MTRTPDDDQPERPAPSGDGGAGLPPETSSLPASPLGHLPDDGEWGSDCLTAGEVAELSRRDWEAVDPDDPAWADDLEYGPPPQWLAMTASGWERLLAEEAERLERNVPEVLDAGFTHSAGGSGNGFSAGGPLDVMLPGVDLGWWVAQERRRGLAAVTDDELIGLMAANRRQVSWHHALEADLVGELDRRRISPDGAPGQHVTQELATSLTLTGWSADALLGQSRELARLPKTRDLLASGIIDQARAAVILRHTALLSDADAAKAEDLILPKAGAMTTGELTSACLRAVIKVDPAAARNRKDKALADARVEAWSEASGTAAIAGRDLPPEHVVMADKHLDQAARWLKANQVDGAHQQLRAMALACLARGDTLHTLLPHPAQTTTRAAGPAGTCTAGQAGHQQRGTGDTSNAPASSPNPATPDSRSAQPECAPGPLAGTVHLVMPYDTWTGRSDNPGEIAGFGAADAHTCRTLATRMTNTGPATRWCITLADPNGRPAAHGCARTGPSPPATSGDPASWLATVTIHPIATSTCAHLHQSASYQPSPTLRHLIKTRSPRCGFPGCRRPATSCDDDHTIPYHLGGRTCECNLHPLCRRHHQCKQTPGWHLDQPHPGQLTWTTPSGRTYTKTTEPLPD